MFIGEINIESLLKAFTNFEFYRLQAVTPLEQTGVVQAFEYTFEQCWKTMKRLLEQEGRTVNSPRESIRAAALEGFITDPELWFEFLKKRNLTSHTYNEEYVEDIIKICPLFSQEVKKFLKAIGVPDHAYGR